jgi:hypothetical protein
MNWYVVVPGIVGGVAGLGGIIGLFLPSDPRVERSMVIKTPPAVPFDLINDLEKTQQWSAWSAKDPSMRITFGEKRTGEGAVYHWTSKKSGEGSYTIARSIPHERIDTDLDFKKQGTGKGYFIFEEVPEGVKVTQGFTMHAGNNLAARYFGLMANGIIGKAFEYELKKIKELAEKA